MGYIRGQGNAKEARPIRIRGGPREARKDVEEEAYEYRQTISNRQEKD